MPQKSNNPVGGVIGSNRWINLGIALLTVPFLGITSYVVWKAERLEKTPLNSMVTGLDVLPKTATAFLDTLSPKSPWPTIHDQARKANVPILMYHDIVPEKEVFFDVTPKQLNNHFKQIALAGATPIHLDQLIQHLQGGTPLPEKPVVLTFDDGYGGHYKHVYPLLKKYQYPATFSIYINKMETKTGRTSISWDQLQEMAADPLVTIAAHSVSHPSDLRQLSDTKLEQEINRSKQILEKRLGIPIKYFTYPAGKQDQRVRDQVAQAGYKAALDMSNHRETFANESENLLQIARFGQSSLKTALSQAWGGHPLPRNDKGFNFNTPIRKETREVGRHTVTLIRGGRPQTIHADSRYQVPEIMEGTQAVAAVDGAFFSLKHLDSNALIGPGLSQQGQQFVPGKPSETPQLAGRPLVLIGHNQAKFVPFKPKQHNTRAGIEKELAGVTDAFVGAAWLVKDNRPQPRRTFEGLYGFDAMRFRAFWGIHQTGQPVVGVSQTRLDSVTLGQVLHEVGLREAVMLDSGASTSLAYQGQSLVGYTPRPVPHVVALFPPQTSRLQARE